MSGRRLIRRMALTALGVGSVAVLAPASAQQSIKPRSPVVTPAGPGYTLVFADEFNGQEVDSDLWSYRVDRKLLSAQRPHNVSEGGGVLTIALLKQKVGDYSYTGGGIVSKRAFRYGYFEVRARTTGCSGWHSAFWAMAADPGNTYNASRRTEIDQFEIDGGDPSRVSQGVIAWQPADNLPSDKYRGVDIGRKTSVMKFDTSAGWHTYGFAWDEQSVRFFVDGEQTNVAQYPARENVHDALNLWLSAIATRKVDDGCVPATVRFDYARYYVRDIYVVDKGQASGDYSETGHWEYAPNPGFTLGDHARVSRDKGATAEWRARLPAGGKYIVYAFVPLGKDSDPNAHFSVVHAGVRTDMIVDMRRQSGWVKLGEWSFRRGDQAVVKVRRGAAEVRADAVKFVRN